MVRVFKSVSDFISVMSLRLLPSTMRVVKLVKDLRGVRSLDVVPRMLSCVSSVKGSKGARSPMSLKSRVSSFNLVKDSRDTISVIWLEDTFKRVTLGGMVLARIIETSCLSVRLCSLQSILIVPLRAGIGVSGSELKSFKKNTQTAAKTPQAPRTAIRERRSAFFFLFRGLSDVDARVLLKAGISMAPSAVLGMYPDPSLICGVALICDGPVICSGSVICDGPLICDGPVICGEALAGSVFMGIPLDARAMNSSASLIAVGFANRLRGS